MEKYTTNNFRSSKKPQDIVIGFRPLQEAIEAGKEIDRVLIRKGLQGELYHQVMRLIRDHQIPFQLVPAEKLERISRANHQGVIAFLSAIEYANLDNIISSIFERGDVPRILLCDEVTDVRNFGAICRSIESFGFHAVVIPDKGSAQINEDAIKSSAGALLNLNVCREKNLVVSCKLIKDSGLKLVVASEKAEAEISQVNLTGPVCVIMGSEERGIRPEIMRMADHLVKIPTSGKTASLNVSVAAGIMMYEVARQSSLS